jgi:hypothetical protein
VYPLYNRRILGGALILNHPDPEESYNREIAEECAETEGMPPLPEEDTPEDFL